MEEYLQASNVVDWCEPIVLELAQTIASCHQTQEAIAKACFEWVRDEIYHSVDHQMNPVTCCASDVLRYKTGYCYAKSHLLAALLRANQIPVGFCYQRLSLDNQGAPYCLHGFNAIYLPQVGWYRVDARGNRVDVDAQFTPPLERLAYSIRLPQEADFSTIWAEPLTLVTDALRRHSSRETFQFDLPDMTVEPDEPQRRTMR